MAEEADEHEVAQEGEQLEIEQDDVWDVDPEKEVVTTSYDITSYGADYPVDGLVKRLQQADIVVPSFEPIYDESDEVRPFQRQFVWSRPQMDRFVESLLLGLPVPGIFLVRDKTNKLLVLDGQQRLRTLQSFYRGFHDDKRYRLANVQAPFDGLGYEDLDDEDRRRLDDSIIHATVLRQDHPAGSQDAVYSIFERLNTGGSTLQPQEIRIALYNGPFLQAISRMNDDPDWRDLYGAYSRRFKDQELLLRVFALYEDSNNYSRPVKSFLNHYLQENSSRDDESIEPLRELFTSATHDINTHIGRNAFRPVRSVNAAVLDAVMVGVMRRLASGPITDGEAMKAAYNELRRNKAFRSATNFSTAAEDSVEARLEAATDAFTPVA
ncbi:hypothetical protein VIMS_03597 [Mycobacterium marinum]|uniref:DUF262 domain-containing protein n=1 Tax=Mycobacterium marinum TaxID=1781 RepID=UPI000EBFA99C|nr:DUF262 domain-containing protein [Mycobacterium marinum]RFZ10241.1 hypothetical protein VIMS_03597 [Mycobacterium marinum]